MTYRAYTWLSVIIFCFVVGLDRFSKMWALCACEHEVVVNQFVSYQCLLNRGISWGLFHSENGSVFLIVSLFITAIISYFVYYTYQLWLQRKSLVGPALVLAGAVSNMADRFLYGGVIDFVIVHYDTWSWPVFNVADVAICLGIGLIVITHTRSDWYNIA